MLIHSYFFSLFIFASLAVEHRFINFDSTVSGSCKRPIEEVQFGGSQKCQFPRISWKRTADIISMVNFSYVSSSDLATWKREVFEEIDRTYSGYDRLCQFLHLLYAPPCVQITGELSVESKFAIAPPCRSYCKAAQSDYTSHSYYYSQSKHFYIFSIHKSF